MYETKTATTSTSTTTTTTSATSTTTTVNYMRALGPQHNIVLEQNCFSNLSRCEPICTAINISAPLCGLRRGKLDAAMTAITRVRRIASYDRTRPRSNFWPWMAGLYQTKMFECGATIVSQKFVITAAHCRGSAAFLASDYVVTAGHVSRSLDEAKKEKGFQSFGVKRFLEHPKFERRPNKFDMLVVEINIPPDSYNSPAHSLGWTFTKRVQPLCISRHNTLDGRKKSVKN